MGIEVSKSILDLFSKLSRESILKAIKFFMWLLPIMLITNELFISKYGNYQFKIEDDFIKEFILTAKPFYSFGVFSFIFIVAYYTEDLIIPLVSVFIATKPDLDRKPRYIIYRTLKKAIGVNIFKGFTLFFKMKGTIDLYRGMAFFPCSLMLWAGYCLFDKVWLSIILLILAGLFIYIISAGINFIESEFKVSNTKMELIEDSI